MNVERIPQEGETLPAHGFRSVHGGKGSNTSVQAARLGAHVEFVGVLGEDRTGDGFFSLAEKEGVSTRFARRTREQPTGTGFVIIDQQGHNIITIDMGANNLLSPDDVDRAADAFKKADVLVMPLEIPLETALYAAACARENNVITILNPAPAANLSACDLSNIDFITPNETEARLCLGLSLDEKINESQLSSRLLDLGCGNVVMTLGAAGSRLQNKKETITRPGFDVDAVDTSGAGDSFNASFAVALAEGQSLGEALSFANAFGALSTTRKDTIPSYHGRKEGEELLKSIVV